MKEEINLLPPPASLLRNRQLILKKAGHLLRLIILLLLIMLIVLLAALGVILTTEKVWISNPKSNAASATKTQQKISDSNGLLAAINKSGQSISPWTTLIPDVLQNIPAGISITQLALDEPTKSLTIMGIFGSFDQVVTYKQQLEKLKWVTSVTAPFNNFTTDSSAHFTLTLTR